MASPKLCHYVQECSITVASKVPLNDIINNRDPTGRIAKWAIELLPFDIIYKPRRAIKSQVLADFVAEWTEAKLHKEYGAYSNWIMHFVGSKCWLVWSGCYLDIPHQRYSPIRTPNTMHRRQQCSRIRGSVAWSSDGCLHGQPMPKTAWGFEPHNISNKWRLRCQGSENGGLS